jgi:hypothetical protein
VELRGLGGAAFEQALDSFRAGEPVLYRGMQLVMRRAAFECRVEAPQPVEGLTDGRALEALTRARFRLGALLASAPPLEAIVGNREPRLVLVGPMPSSGPAEELYDLRGDRLRRLRGGGAPGHGP